MPKHTLGLFRSPLAQGQLRHGVKDLTYAGVFWNRPPAPVSSSTEMRAPEVCPCESCTLGLRDSPVCRSAGRGWGHLGKGGSV